MDKWHFRLETKKPRLNKPLLIEGMPGIGNVGKIVVDFLIDSLNAVKLYDVFSYSMPNSVFINDNNLIELPGIEVYYKKFNNKAKRDLLLLTGDVQPIDERASYSFSDSLIKVAKEYNVKDIVTLGGIGLNSIPKRPKVYCTGTSTAVVKRFIKDTKLKPDIYGVVGSIFGISGLLLGLAKRHKINAVSLLAETFGHPLYIGVPGARSLLKELAKSISLDINIKDFNKDVKSLESDVAKKAKELSEIEKLISSAKQKQVKDTNYIG